MDKDLAIIALQKAADKKKKRNERAKKMRERRGDELKEKNKEYVRIHREKKKKELEEAISVIKGDILPKELPIKKDIIRIEKEKGEFISRLERTGIKGVTEKTAINYINKISVIHNLISKNLLDKETLKKIFIGKEESGDEKKIIENMDYIDNLDELIKIIEDKYENLQSRKAYISAYLTLISYLSKTKKENYEKLREKFEEINNAIYGIRGENERSDNEELIDSFEEYNILENANKLKIEDEIIYLFYTLQPPRRIEDVYLITITNKNNNTEDNINYIIVDNDNNPLEIIYNKYKTNKIYGRQIITLTNKILKDKIREYIYLNNLKEGDKLFRKFNNSASFGVAIKRIFSKVYDKKITLNNIRHSYITWELRELRSVNYLKNLAMMMGHSSEEQQLYRRIK